MFRELLTFDEAKKALKSHFRTRPLGVEEVSLLESSNRVLADNATASTDVPPFSRSTVDGYAVRAEDTFGASENEPVVLKVLGTVNIGELSRIGIERGEAAEIVTGAPVPQGADAIVMMEDTSRKGDRISVFASVARDENVMKAGTDVRRGETVLKKARILGSREIGVLAALGRSKVRVYRVPNVAVFSTGPEITEPGRPLSPGRIYDINAYSLSAAVIESGGKPLYLGVFRDDLMELRGVLRRALASSDVIVTSGGVSVGPRDVMPKALSRLGKPGIVFSGVAIKPGKPMTVASVAGRPVFSLPGHPTSALLTFQLFVSPMIQAMSGRKVSGCRKVEAVASMRMFPAKGRRTFVMVKLKHRRTGGLAAEPLETSLSGAITTLAKADGFLEIAEDTQFVDAGERVVVQLF